MGHKSLGDFIEAADAVGEVKQIHGAALELEVGCLTELSAERNGPLLLFDRFEGFPEDFRVASNVVRNNRRRYALAMGLPLDAHAIAMVQELRQRRRTRQPFAPLLLNDGPVLAHRISGQEVDISKFPAPVWHSGDGGRYIGTGDIVIVQDPESGWINFGTYRVCVQGKDKLSIWIIRHKRSRLIAEKYWSKGQACPVAVVLGCDPLTYMAGTSRLKYEEAGALHGAPVEVVKAPWSGLPVPAHAEIVMEGEIPSPAEETVQEGPFGEWPGYYSHCAPECVIRVKEIVHRSGPIINGTPPLRPLIGLMEDVPALAVAMWDHLERSGISDVVGVWGHANALFIVVAVKQRYPGHAQQALLAAAGLRGSASMYSYYVAVDDDIDPSDLKEVIWAMSTRVNPATALEVVHNAWTSDLDPRLTPEQKSSGDYTMGRLLINACKPYSWKNSFPRTNIFSSEERQGIRQKWAVVLREIEEMAGKAAGKQK
ncbi:MAG: UbiD family decarboxylase [Desulfobacterales bacterium]|nr:UbiD family decarboxylase [Desulfobacterales bacterium]